MSEAGCVVGGRYCASWQRCRAAHVSDLGGFGEGRLVDTGGETVKLRLPCGVAVEGKLSSSTTGRLFASLHPTFEHHQMVHQLLHAGARRGRELLGCRVIHRCGDTAELVGPPRQRPGLPQQRRDRLRRRRLRPVHVIVGHAVGHAVDCAGCRSQAAHDEPSSGNSWCVGGTRNGAGTGSPSPHGPGPLGAMPNPPPFTTSARLCGPMPALSSRTAAVGDRITAHGLHVGDASRCGEVLEVKGAGGEPPYVVRWWPILIGLVAR